jgi:hypothetical protein
VHAVDLERLRHAARAIAAMAQRKTGSQAGLTPISAPSCSNKQSAMVRKADPQTMAPSSIQVKPQFSKAVAKGSFNTSKPNAPSALAFGARRESFLIG